MVDERRKSRPEPPRGPGCGEVDGRPARAPTGPAQPRRRRFQAGPPLGPAAKWGGASRAPGITPTAAPRPHGAERRRAGRRAGDPARARGARGAKRRGAGRAPGRVSPAAAPRSRGAKRRRAGRRAGDPDPGPRGPGCEAARRGPRAGEIPGGGAARSWSEAKTGRPRAGPRRPNRNGGEACQRSVQRANNGWGKGCLASNVANRAEKCGYG
jgi:hypothetical protein